VLHTEYPAFVPRAEDAGQCLLVWDRHRRPGGGPGAPGLPEDVERLAAALGVSLTGAHRAGVVEAPFHLDRRHVRRVDYILVPEGAGHCR
jgi:hypothetical protein